MRSKTASICPVVRTSSGMKIGASELVRERLDIFLALSLR